MVVYGETPAEGGEAEYDKFYEEVSVANQYYLFVLQLVDHFHSILNIFKTPKGYSSLHATDTSHQSQ